MSKCYVICHMLTSLDGKIDGAYMSAPECAPAPAVFKLKEAKVLDGNTLWLRYMI